MNHSRVGRLASAVVAVAMLMAVFAVPATAQSSGTFVDDDGNIHETNIEFIASYGVTKGCNPPTNTNYCPSGTVTRGQMAAFLVRALQLPATSTDFFSDDETSVFEGDINRLAAAGITSGCNPPANSRYCPDGKVTRGQMAAFLNRAFKLSPTTTDYFIDDNGSIFQGDINELAASSITLGCNPPTNNKFCPDQTVKRDQMASFLARALTNFPTSDPIVVQTAFGVYTDGPQSSAPLAADAINRAAIVTLNAPFSVRFGMANTGSQSVSVRPRLQYRYIGSELPGPTWSAWANVTASSARVRAAASSALTDGAPTTERLNGSRAFVTGAVDEVDGAIGSSVSLAGNSETEFLFSIKLISPTTQNDQYEFRLVSVLDGDTYNAYGLTPSVNIPFSFANGFDKGTVGSIITITGSADPQGWSQVNPTSDPGAPRYDSMAFSGPLSGKFARLASTTESSYVRYNDFNQARHLYGRLYFRYTGAPAPTGARIVDVVGGYNYGDSNSHSITITGADAGTSAGKIAMKAGGQVGTAGETNLLLANTTLAADTWYRIEWHAATESVSGLGDGQFEVRLYNAAGSLLESGSIASPLAFTLTEFEDIDFGPRSQTITTWLDEIALSNSGWVGP